MPPSISRAVIAQHWPRLHDCERRSTSTFGCNTFYLIRPDVATAMLFASHSAESSSRLDQMNGGYAARISLDLYSTGDQVHAIDSMVSLMPFSQILPPMSSGWWVTRLALPWWILLGAPPATPSPPRRISSNRRLTDGQGLDKTRRHATPGKRAKHPDRTGSCGT